jgi:hypothetical protein
VLLAAAPALAGEEDRPASADELARMRKALEAKGYSDLQNIEVDCRIELDAKNKAGQSMDLELDLETLEILDEEANEPS